MHRVLQNLRRAFRGPRGLLKRGAGFQVPRAGLNLTDY